MRPLHRPMFRYGGPIKEGVMSGIKEPVRKAALVGNSVYPQTGGREHHNWVKTLLGFGTRAGAGTGAKETAKKTVGTEATKKIKSWFQPKKMPDTVRYGLGRSRVPTKWEGVKNWYRTTPFGKYVAGTPEGKGITYALSAGKGIVPKVAKAAVKSPVGMVGGAYMLDAFPGGQPLLNLDILGNRNILGQKYDPETDKRIKGTGISSLWEDEEKKLPPPPEGDKSIFEIEKIVTEPKKSADEIRAERIQKYRDIMDIKGMNQRAAYDSLIDASKIIQESGDFKGDIKSGNLINQIIQATSKQFDKPAKTKDAIDTLILKGEIEADIAAGKPSTYLKTAQDMVATGAAKNITEAMKTLTKSSTGMATTLGAIVSKGGRLDEENVGIAYREETGNIPKGMIKKSEVSEWIEDNPGKNELDYTKELLTKTEIAPGDYVIGTRVVTIDKDKNVSFFY